MFDAEQGREVSPLDQIGERGSSGEEVGESGSGRQKFEKNMERNLLPVASYREIRKSSSRACMCVCVCE